MTKPVRNLMITITSYNTNDGCEINPVPFAPHASGTTVGRCQIGTDTTIYQNATLGSKKQGMSFEVSIRSGLDNNVNVGACWAESRSAIT